MHMCIYPANKKFHALVFVLFETCIKLLTWKDSACPYFALILGSRMVARLVPLTVNGVPPLQTEKVGGR